MSGGLTVLFKSLEELDDDRLALFEKFQTRLETLTKEDEAERAARAARYKKATTLAELKKLEAEQDEAYRVVKQKAAAFAADLRAEVAAYEKLFKRSRRFILQLGSR